MSNGRPAGFDECLRVLAYFCISHEVKLTPVGHIIFANGIESGTYYGCRPIGAFFEQTQRNDPAEHPKHYTSHPSGIECIQITEHMTFCLGNAVKYIWRADLKHDDSLEDLRKAKWYIEREIAKRGKRA